MNSIHNLGSIKLKSLIISDSVYLLSRHLFTIAV